MWLQIPMHKKNMFHRLPGGFLSNTVKMPDFIMGKAIIPLVLVQTHVLKAELMTNDWLINFYAELFYVNNY